MKISTILPDVATFSSQPPQLTDTVVIHASTAEKYAYPEHATPYLLISNFVNRGNYALNRRRVEVSASHFYFLNPYDTLEILFPTAAPLQTCMILFEEQFMNSCCHYLSAPDQHLLDPPHNHRSLRFVDLPFDMTDTIKRQISLLVRSRPDQDAAQEVLFDLIAECTRLNAGTGKEVGKIAAVKQSTREELYRRLYLSREWINDNLTGKITLDQMAAIACLNKFHYLVSFRQVFATTPHRYLMEKRLQKAFDWLKEGRHTVTDVCAILGFESLGSFSNQFKKRFGAPPSTLRAHQ